MSRIEQFARFVLIGGFATAIQYAILIALVQSNLAEVVVASSIGFAISAFANYGLNRRFTFRSSRDHRQALPRFIVVTVLGLALNAGIVWMFHVGVKQHYLVAQALATIATLAWNFVLNRAWTFARPQSPAR